MADIIIYDSHGNVLSTIDFSGLSAMTDVDKADSVLVYDTSLATNKKATIEELFEGGINTATTETTIADGDYVPIYDVSATALRKMTKSDFVSGAAVPSGTVIQTNSATPPSGYTYITPVGLTLPPNDTLDANVKLLLRGDGASIADDKGHSLTLTGTPVISSTRAKFGSSSIYSGASSQRINLTDSADWDFGSGDFCIDCWVYFDSDVANYKGLWNQDSAGTGYSPILWSVYSGVMYLWASSTGSSWDVLNDVGGSGTISTGAWHHLALSRSGTAWKMFVDGAVVYSGTAAGTLFNSTNTVGILQYQNRVVSFDGYIDHFRVTKGNARYTAAFTPDTGTTLYYHLKT